MDRLMEMEAFAKVVDNGGFTDAAKKMGLSKSAISKHVSSLEARLGARLLNRTTRRVSPTEIGLAYYDKAKQVLVDAIEADAMVSSMQIAPRGSLRLGASPDFGGNHLSQALGGFLGQYPEVSVDMVLSNRNLDPVADSFDLVIRVGQQQDSSIMAKKLASTRMQIIGSPSYFEEHGMPTRIDELNQHSLLHYSNQPSGSLWKLCAPSGEMRTVRASGNLTANDGQSLLRAAEAGLGIAFLPCFLYHKALEAGTIIPALTDLPVQSQDIYAMYPHGQYTQPKLRAFLDYLSDHFKNKGMGNWA
ncbi:MAG: LysR family transcriptional regulator [Proteobacteria bacterium]|nr:LysR family transcriptional regulator [Pseudomonadota bacterium]